jgi:hypothetical protein
MIKSTVKKYVIPYVTLCHLQISVPAALPARKLGFPDPNELRTSVNTAVLPCRSEPEDHRRARNDWSRQICPGKPS